MKTSGGMTGRPGDIYRMSYPFCNNHGSGKWPPLGDISPPPETQGSDIEPGNTTTISVMLSAPKPMERLGSVVQQASKSCSIAIERDILMGQFSGDYGHLKFNSSTLKSYLPKRKVVFPTRGCVKLRGCTLPKTKSYSTSGKKNLHISGDWNMNSLK